MSITLDLEMWKELSETRAISGYEHLLHPTITKYLKPYTDSIMTDNISSIIGLKNGLNPNLDILLAAHIDEIGFQVKEISDEGYIYLQNVGGWWPHTLLAQQLCIDTRDGKEIIGCVGSKIPHGMSSEERTTVLSMEDLYIDLGVSSKEEVEKLGVRVGDPIAPYSKFRVMNQAEYLYGKAWDDRCCLGIILEVMRYINGKQEANVYAAGTAQEEVGQRGARTVAHMLNPTISIALDVCDAEDTPYHMGDISLGKGPVLTVMDGSSIANPKLLEYVENMCIKNNIPYRYSCSKDGGTDNGNIHKSMSGIIGMTISVPVRYMHSASAILHQKDMIDTIELVSKICNELTSGDVENIINYNR